MDCMQYECNNAFLNLECVPEPFFLGKSAGARYATVVGCVKQVSFIIDWPL